MNARLVLAPLALVGALAVTSADAAHASPTRGAIGPQLGTLQGGRVTVGVGVDIPVRGPRRHHRHHHVRPVREVTYVGGYYETRVGTRKVWHPARIVGYDAHGYPIKTTGHYDIEEYTYQVWIPRRRVVRVVRAPVRRVVVHPRPAPYVRVGGSVRFR